MVRNLRQSLRAVIIHLVDGLFLRIDRLGDKGRDRKRFGSDILRDLRIVSDHFRDDITSPRQRFLRRIDFFLRVYKRRGRVLRRSIGQLLRVKDHGKRFQALFLGLGRARCLLLLERFV